MALTQTAETTTTTSFFFSLFSILWWALFSILWWDISSRSIPSIFAFPPCDFPFFVSLSVLTFSSLLSLFLLFVFSPLSLSAEVYRQRVSDGGQVLQTQDPRSPTHQHGKGTRMESTIKLSNEKEHHPYFSVYLSNSPACSTSLHRKNISCFLFPLCTLAFFSSVFLFLLWLFCLFLYFFLSFFCFLARLLFFLPVFVCSLLSSLQAALNMLTRTSSQDYAKDKIFMNSVGTMRLLPFRCSFLPLPFLPILLLAASFPPCFRVIVCFPFALFPLPCVISPLFLLLFFLLCLSLALSFVPFIPLLKTLAGSLTKTLTRRRNAYADSTISKHRLMKKMQRLAFLTLYVLPVSSTTLILFTSTCFIRTQTRCYTERPLESVWTRIKKNREDLGAGKHRDGGWPRDWREWTH